MGAWVIGNFDNDAAGDWAFELEECSDLTAIENAIEAVFKYQYLDVDTACEALAAIDTLARLRGNFGQQTPYTENVDEWVSTQKLTPPDALIQKAVKAAQIIMSEGSEVYELWSETEALDAWKKEVEDVIKRVST